MSTAPVWRSERLRGRIGTTAGSARRVGHHAQPPAAAVPHRDPIGIRLLQKSKDSSRLPTRRQRKPHCSPLSILDHRSNLSTMPFDAPTFRNYGDTGAFLTKGIFAIYLMYRSVASRTCNCPSSRSVCSPSSSVSHASAALSCAAASCDLLSCIEIVATRETSMATRQRACHTMELL